MSIFKTKPVVLNALQLRLAIELAAQRAAQLEIEHQLGPYFPNQRVTVDRCTIDLRSLEWDGPFILPDGRKVEWTKS